MELFLIILIVVAAIILTLLILVQNSKGGGLASGFSSGNQVLGAPKTADFLEKSTWGLIAVIVVLSILAVGIAKHQGNINPEDSQIEDTAAEQVEDLQNQQKTAPVPAEDANAEAQTTSEESTTAETPAEGETK